MAEVTRERAYRRYYCLLSWFHTFSREQKLRYSTLEEHWCLSQRVRDSVWLHRCLVDYPWWWFIVPASFSLATASSLEQMYASSVHHLLAQSGTSDTQTRARTVRLSTTNTRRGTCRDGRWSRDLRLYQISNNDRGALEAIDPLRSDRWSRQSRTRTSIPTLVSELSSK